MTAGIVGNVLVQAGVDATKDTKDPIQDATHVSKLI